MKKIKVGIIQQSNTADIRVNLMNLAKSIEACAAHGAQLIVLQELHNSLYFCQTENTNLFDLAEPIPGPSTGFYSELAAANKVVLVTSLFEKRAPGLYHNTAVVFDRDGSIAGKYRKMHIPDDPAYYEKFYFTPGDIGFEPIQTSLGKLGVLVCWDQWYPEAARLMALKGAELLIYPTAIGWESSDTDDEKARQLNAWIISQRAHAVANGLPVISVNRVGHEPDPSGQTNGILFWGNSFVAGPQGEFLAQAGNDHPENMVVEIDMERSENVRRWWPFLRDRRIDEYEAVTNAIKVMKITHADALKLEGGVEIIDAVKKIIAAGIPIMGHLGLMPQSINKYGTYTVRAKDEEEAEKLLSDAHLLEETGCFALVLEKIPASLAERVARELTIPVIGIGAGGAVDGQVLVVSDMLGMTNGFSPRFLRRYADLHTVMTGAIQQYVDDVKKGDFPNEDEQY